MRFAPLAKKISQISNFNANSLLFLDLFLRLSPESGQKKRLPQEPFLHYIAFI